MRRLLPLLAILACHVLAGTPRAQTTFFGQAAMMPGMMRRPVFGVGPAMQPPAGMATFAAPSMPGSATGPIPGPIPGSAPGSALCRAAIAQAERGAGIPDKLMVAIGMVESGRRDPQTGTVGPWPWTINAEGAGSFFETKAAALAAVQALQARGVRSIDVGCMQVNLLHHGSNFASLDQAFDPVANARYAAKFLGQLFTATGDWTRAAAGYHSMTPELGQPYAAKVMSVWPGQQREPVPVIPASYAAQPVAPSGSYISMAGGSTARIIPMAGLGATGLTGRTLDSYRSSPTRVAVQLLPGRAPF